MSDRPNSCATQETSQIRRKHGHDTAVTTTDYLQAFNPEIYDGINRDDSLERGDVLNNTQEKMA